MPVSYTHLYDWVVFEYNGGQYWTALIGDRNRLERDDTTDDCSRQLAEAKDVYKRQG